ncbi:50S ribosomal protein L1 [Candidatus Uhrbacteria bacterium]|nr:50S ribosomal protein L1 [Candidatus Uhrbacteria bacterium]
MTRKQSKSFQSRLKAIDRAKKYSPEDALKIVKELSYEKFDASIEIHVKTGIDPKKGEQVVRGSVVLPHSTGKKKRIAVFAEGDQAKEAKKLGADLVGGQELIDEIKKTGKVDFDVAIATPDMMKGLAGIARILGPRGLMPSPKNNTVAAKVKSVIDEVLKGRIDFKNDSGGNVHCVIGTRSVDADKLLANYHAFFDALRRARSSTVKGVFIKGISLSSTMGPSISVAV